MAAKKKPVLVRCGNAFINPEDVSNIKSVKKGKLWIVKLKSEPNPEFPIFVEDCDEGITNLLMHFDIKE